MGHGSSAGEAGPATSVFDANGQDLLDKRNNDPRSKFVALGWMDAGVRNAHGKKPVRVPADLKGQKIRMMGHLIIPETLIFSKRTWDALSPEDRALRHLGVRRQP